MLYFNNPGNRPAGYTCQVLDPRSLRVMHNHFYAIRGSRDQGSRAVVLCGRSLSKTFDGGTLAYAPLQPILFSYAFAIAVRSALSPDRRCALPSARCDRSPTRAWLFLSPIRAQDFFYPVAIRSGSKVPFSLQPSSYYHGSCSGARKDYRRHLIMMLLFLYS